MRSEMRDRTRCSATWMAPSAVTAGDVRVCSLRLPLAGKLIGALEAERGARSSRSVSPHPAIDSASPRLVNGRSGRRLRLGERTETDETDTNGKVQLQTATVTATASHAAARRARRSATA